MDQNQPNVDGEALERPLVAQELLNVQKKQRSNLFPWNGQFSPQLVEVLLRAYAPQNGLVLDPFAGSGTVLYEASSLGMPAIGAEINPAACKMAQICSLVNIPVAKRRTLANQLEKAIQEQLPNQEPSLFSVNSQATNKGLKEALVELHSDLALKQAKPERKFA